MKTTNKPLREAIEDIVLGAVVVAPPKFPLKDGDPLFTIRKRTATNLILKELEARLPEKKYTTLSPTGDDWRFYECGGWNAYHDELVRVLKGDDG